MSFLSMLRKVFLCIALGGGSFLGISMTHEKIEEILHSMNRPTIEATLPQDEAEDGNR
jgi:hypothetical protein